MKQISAASKSALQSLFISLLILTGVYGCRRDFGHYSEIGSASVLTTHGIDLGMLQNVYAAGTSSQLKVNAVSPADLSKIIGTLNVDWDTIF